MNQILKISLLNLAILSLHLAANFLGAIPGNFKHLAFIDLFLFVIFTFGIYLTLAGMKKNHERFALNFLIMTTFQLLLMLSLVLVLLFGKIDHVAIIGFNAISMFVILLVVQSTILVKTARAN